MSAGLTLAAENIYFLQSGHDLLSLIDDSLYSNNENIYFASGVGRHMRHVLDHYSNFLNAPDGEIDYDSRERNKELEGNRGLAMETINELITDMTAFARGGAMDKPMNVKYNSGVGNKGESSSSEWVPTTPARELQFLISHTVHHYALIAMILHLQGYEASPDFGVAPSTLTYQNSLLSETI